MGSGDVSRRNSEAIVKAREHVLRRFRWVDGHADVWVLFENAQALASVISGLAVPWRDSGITAVVGVEARGLLLGAAVADRLGAGFHAIRKEGALFPGPKLVAVADIDYRGRRHRLSMRDTLSRDDTVLLVDDWAQHGSQALAARALVERTGARWAGASLIVDQLTDDVRARLGHVVSLVDAAELGDP